MSRRKLWKTKDTKIRIMDMGDEHLINTALFLEAKHEMVLLCMDPDALMQSSVGDTFPIYDDIVEEIDRRGLCKALDDKREEKRCQR